MNKIIIAKDKTKTPTSKATYQLIPEVKELLLTLKEKEAENRKLFGKAYFDSDYVFKHEDGTLFRPDYVLKRFKKTLKQNNFPEMRFHDLRHSTASILYDKGWNIKDIQEWLRHADIETTGNIYTHISRSRKQALASDLSNTFSL